MSDDLVDQTVDALLANIEAKRIASGYIDNTFDVDATYYPSHTLEDLAAGKKQVWLVGMTYDELPTSRSNAAEIIIPIQVGLQVYVEDVKSNTEVRPWNQLGKQLRTTCREYKNTDDTFAWLGNEALKDENGLPMYYTGYRQNVYESYFIVRYKTFLTGV